MPDIAPITAAAAELATQSESMLAQATEALTAIGAAIASQQKGRSNGTFSWSNGREKLEVKYDGDLEFTDDDADLKSLSPGGYLRIKEGSQSGGRKVEFTADAAGTITRRFWVGSSEKPFEPEGRQWLAQALPRFIRQTGLGAKGRVARILKAKGPSGVLAEISLIEGSWAKRVYFNELLNSGNLDGQMLRQTVAQAGRELDSDFERASLLIDSCRSIPRRRRRDASGLLRRGARHQVRFRDAARLLVGAEARSGQFRDPRQYPGREHGD